MSKNKTEAFLDWHDFFWVAQDAPDIRCLYFSIFLPSKGVPGYPTWFVMAAQLNNQGDFSKKNLKIPFPKIEFTFGVANCWSRFRSKHWSNSGFRQRSIGVPRSSLDNIGLKGLCQTGTWYFRVQ